MCCCQALQDKVKQLEAAATTAAAAAEGTTSELRMQLEAERAEARRNKMEASSTIKQYEQLVQRLRREADASECQHAVGHLVSSAGGSNASHGWWECRPGATCHVLEVCTTVGSKSSCCKHGLSSSIL